MSLQKQRIEVLNLISKKVLSWGDQPAPKSDAALDALVRTIYGLPPQSSSTATYSFITPSTPQSEIDTPVQRVLKRLDVLGIRLAKPICQNCFHTYVLGIEGLGQDWKSNCDRIDEYNDLVCTIDVNQDGVVTLSKAYRGTTEAGKYYTDNPLNAQGAAHVKLDFMHKDIWVLGKHNNQFNCLVQTGGEITITRDLNRDGTRLGDSPSMSGYYGINLHSAMDNLGSIGKWSAGCCVIPKVSEKDALVNHIQKAVNKKISYILLDGSKL